MLYFLRALRLFVVKPNVPNSSKLTDTHHLRTSSYRDPARLNARIALHERFSTNPHPWHAWVFDQIEIPPRAQILEVGCGPGGFWQKNHQRIPAHADIILTDLSHGMLSAARTKLGTSQFKYACADAQSLPLSAASFDLIIANHMLYHLPGRQRAYRQFQRLLKPGGKLYASTNGVKHLHELVDLIQGFDPNIDYQGLNLGFNLGNGQRELQPWFADVELHLYPDSLEITAAQPLSDYITSMSFFTPETFSPDRIARLTAHLQSIIDQRGSIHITKSVGLFIAHKS